MLTIGVPTQGELGVLTVQPVCRDSYTELRYTTRKYPDAVEQAGNPFTI